jgi:hypothetical protein
MEIDGVIKKLSDNWLTNSAESLSSVPMILSYFVDNEINHYAVNGYMYKNLISWWGTANFDRHQPARLAQL